MNRREKILALVTVILLVLLIVKSFVIDPYHPKNEGEENFQSYVNELIEEKYSGGIYDILVKIRIVDIDVMSETEKEYRDENDEIQKADGTYKAKVRKYILGILPYSDERILEGVTK